MKINVFSWRLSLDKLPIRVVLHSHGLDVLFFLCPLRENGLETSSHLFFSCDFVLELCALISRWWDISILSLLLLYTDWLVRFKVLRLSLDVKNFVEAIFYVYWWNIWSFKNATLFSKDNSRVVIVYDNIITQSFFGVMLGVRKMLIGMGDFITPTSSYVVFYLFIG